MTREQSKKWYLIRVVPDNTLTDCPELVLTSVPIRARVRKLRARWTIEDDQRMEVGVEESAEDDLRRMLEEMQREP